MNLLWRDPPQSVCRIGNDLVWDIDCDGQADEVFDIAVSYRSILEIFEMMNGKSLTDREKQVCILRMFYMDNLPEDLQSATELANEFMQCGKGTAEPVRYEKPLYSWRQDGDFIHAAINQAFNGILDKEPDLHWWKFVNCFMNIGENCRINEIITNRAAHRKGKATKEQKEARRLYPEVYVLQDQRKSDDETINRAKELENLMNST